MVGRMSQGARGHEPISQQKSSYLRGGRRDTNPVSRLRPLLLTGSPSASGSGGRIVPTTPPLTRQVNDDTVSN